MSVVMTIALFGFAGQLSGMPADPPILPEVSPPDAPFVQVVPPQRDPPVIVQSARGVVAGRVSDHGGGVLPGVRVTLRRLDGTTEQVYNVLTDTRGEYRIVDVLPGSYELSVSLAGFRTTKGQIQVTANQQFASNIVLQLGSLTEVVNVSSPHPLVDTKAQTRTEPQTAVWHFDAAKRYYEQGRLVEAEQQATRALELIRAAMTASVSVSGKPVTPESAPTSAQGPVQPIRVGGDIKEPKKIRHISPVYPAVAQAAAVQGVVILEAVIGRDGNVKNLQVLRSVPLLDQAAIDAVSQWGFTPTLLNGVPVEVIMTVSVNFSLR